MLFTTGFSLLGPWVLKFAIDQLKEAITTQLLLKFAGLLVAVALVEGIFRFLMRQTIIGVSRKIEYNLRNDFLGHLQKLTQSFYNQFKTGDLMARATNACQPHRTDLKGRLVCSSRRSIQLLVTL